LSALEGKGIGAKVFFKNLACDKENNLKNNGKPFYTVSNLTPLNPKFRLLSKKLKGKKLASPSLKKS
jgi:hypothetical protein